MPKIIAALLLLSLAQLANAEWSAVNRVDDFTDEVVRFAVFKDDAHSIQVSRQGEDESVWMFIERTKIGQFHPYGSIEMRVDKNETYGWDTEELRRLEEMSKSIGLPTMYQWEPATIGVLIWHGNEAEGCGKIGEMISGQEFKFRYQVSKSERESFSITLAGAREALVEGLGLTVCGK